MVRRVLPGAIEGAAVLVLATALFGCGDEQGGGTGGGGGNTGAGGDGGQSQIAADRATLGACGLDESCGYVTQVGANNATGDYTCIWNAMIQGGGRFYYSRSLDGCSSDCNSNNVILYVDAGVAYFSSSESPLRRCTPKPASFFQACIDARAAAQPDSIECLTFGEWVDGCVEAAASCP